jgi:hypothetical protein
LSERGLKAIHCADYTISLIEGLIQQIFTAYMGRCACSSKKHGHADVCGCPTPGSKEFCENCESKIKLDQRQGGIDDPLPVSTNSRVGG